MKKLRKRKRKIVYYKNKRILMYSILGLFLFLGMGYSVLNTNLNILGDITVKEYVEPTLYNVLKKEAETNGLAKEYTEEHGDSMDSSLSTEKIYLWNSTSYDTGNVIFANHCWKIIRTTDTGGVKMIYNGEAVNNKCLNTRENHVGYAFSFVRNLASNYWYGTDYTYDSINKVFSIAGTTEQATWSNATSDSLIGKYTCLQTTENGTCNTLNLIESYSDNNSANVIQLNSNTNYFEFGRLKYNNSRALFHAGYMYGDVYSTNSSKAVLEQSYPVTRDPYAVFSSENLSTSFWYADDISYDNSTGGYSLVNPYRVSSTSDYENLVGKYTFCDPNQLTTSVRVRYIAGVNNSTMYYKLLENGNLLSSYEPLVFGDSVIDNNDDTYTLTNPQYVSLLDWYTDYANYKNKFICDGVNLICNDPKYIVNSSSVTYNYVSDDILIAKSRNGLVLNDTLLLPMYELMINYSDYSDYKYTCNSTSASCTEGNLRIIDSFTSTGYNYAPNRYYGSSVTWDGTNYILVDPIELESYKDYNNLATHHYYCSEPGLKTCQTVEYLFQASTNFWWRYSITLKDGVSSISQAMDDMFVKNTEESIIKKGVDAWYKHYILDYDQYIEDTIYCNDRSIVAKAGWNPTGAVLGNRLKFNSTVSDNSYTLGYEIDLTCPNITDRFSINNNQAKLTYKVGLMTKHEKEFVSITSVNQSYWLMSPQEMDDECENYNVNNNIISYSPLVDNLGVRPVISLIPGMKYSCGDGSMESPYYIGETYNITNTNKLFKVSKKAAVGYNISITAKNHVVTSFKLNGTLIEGDTFTMPAEDVEITDIQYVPAYYTITNTDTLIEVPAKGRYGDTITLDAGEEHVVTSFRMNGTLIEGNTFTMPLEDVEITDITKIPQVTIESEHNPYPNSQNNVVYYENTFEGATSLSVELTYQTENTSYDWIYLYDDENSTTPVNNKKYGGNTLQTETITINSNYLKILFRTDYSGNNYYGFKAVITPNYD